jgi:glucosamine--fructose-6-phosphate aminotransferase (isomerizing)
MSRTSQEISLQFDAMEKTYGYLVEKRAEIVAFFQTHGSSAIHFVGCGSSYTMCQSGADAVRFRAGRNAYAWAAGDVMLNVGRYGTALVGGVVVAPTRSGRTTEILRAIQVIRDAWSTPVLSIVCATGTPVAALSDLCLELPWAYDDSVCQTRSVSNLYLAEMMIAAFLAKDEALLVDLKKAIEAGPELEKRYAAALREIAGRSWSEAVVLADGEAAGLGAEAAMALLEISRVAGRHYHVLDVRHGPMAVVDEKSLVLLLGGPAGSPEVRKLTAEIVATGAVVVSYSDMPSEPVAGVALYVSSGFLLDPAAQGLPFIFLAQSLASGKADALGIDPDAPAGISAWVDLA